jgi:uncharacterized protein YbaA (DUF1428 family)
MSRYLAVEFVDVIRECARTLESVTSRHPDRTDIHTDTSTFRSSRSGRGTGVYTALARRAAKVWKGYGALEYVECIADDVKWGKRTSFPRSVKMKRPTETVFFSYIIYKSRRDRDRIMKKVMADPRLADMMDLKKIPFDAKRMIFGGFRTVVDV